MSAEAHAARGGFLSPYRVLDLTDHRGALAGHMFAQLGADVIQVEPPQGSDARRHGPFAPDWPEGEDSLYWAAFASGKRSIVCDPATPEDEATFDKLVQSADFLIESCAPSEGRPAFLDPAALAALNPRLIHVSLTPFGLEGPKADWVDTEITLWAAGGPLIGTRTLDDVPIRISVPQAYHHAAADAANAALIAHFARVRTGRGQHIEVTVQQSVPQTTLTAVLAAAVGHDDFTPKPPRPGAAKGGGGLDLSGSGARTRRSKWPLADGLAEMHLAMGPTAGVSTNQLFALMKREGALDAKFHDWDWLTLHRRVQAGEISFAEIEEARAAVARFLATHRKADMMEIALETGVRIAPVETVADLVASPHAQARGFFQTLRGPFGDYVVPGDFALGAPGAFPPLTPAPRLGEHTAEILAELGAAQ
jgi:crotonobetainyl-CoA:carnitine CoA-transferase CaiB-like acyl-CoA transferase